MDKEQAKKLARAELIKKHPEMAHSLALEDLKESLLDDSRRKSEDNVNEVRIQAMFEKMKTKGEKGDGGYTPLKGVDYMTEEDINNIKQGIRDEVTPQKDVHYFDGKDGKDAEPLDEKAIISRITSSIKVPKDGKDGRNGKDGSPDSPEVIAKKLNMLEGSLDYKVLTGIPKQTPVSVKSIIAEMKKLPESDRLDISDIRNGAWNNPAKGKLDQRWHGGGMSNPMTTTGDTIYGGAGGLATRLAIGTTGQVLTVSAGGVPTWSAGGGSGTITSVASADGSITVTNPTTTPDLAVVKAPRLSTARTINGTSFDGTANITVTAAAGTLTGTTLNATVVTSSLTSVGTIATGVWQGTKVGLAYGGTNADLSATGGTSQVLKQTSVGGTVTVAQLAASDLSNGTTGSGSVVLATSPTLTTAVLGSSTATTQSPADNSTKVATTAYVDNAVLGQRLKEAVKYSSIAALPSIVYANGSSGVGATLTGVALAAISLDSSSPSVNDRVLIKNQVSTFQNGIYTVTATGSGIAVFVLTRATDFDQAADIQTGDSVFVTAGSTLANTTWAYTGGDNPVMGTDALTFTQAAGPGSYTGGNGITITGTSIAIDTAITVDKTTAQTLTNKNLTSGTNTFPTLNQNTTGTAAGLTTARTINGVSFDGTANIVIPQTLWTATTVNATMAINNGYIANKGTLLTMTLPTTAAVGSTVTVTGMNAGLWLIAQNASGIIHFGNQNTTTGVGGSLASTNTYDSVTLVCSVANNEWVVVNSVGNLTVT